MDPHTTQVIIRARDSISKAIDLLSREMVPEAVLELEKARSILRSEFPEVPKGRRKHMHDWMVVDPYTAQCRICGKQRPLRTEEPLLSPLST